MPTFPISTREVNALGMPLSESLDHVFCLASGPVRVEVWAAVPGVRDARTKIPGNWIARGWAYQGDDCIWGETDGEFLCLAGAARPANSEWLKRAEQLIRLAEKRRSFA